MFRFEYDEDDKKLQYQCSVYDKDGFFTGNNSRGNSFYGVLNLYTEIKNKVHYEGGFDPDGELWLLRHDIFTEEYFAYMNSYKRYYCNFKL